VKFTPARGEVRISTRNDAGHYIIIDFTDTAVGISPALQPRIFEAFEQGGIGVTNRYGGIGLGLGICERLIDLYGRKSSVRRQSRRFPRAFHQASRLGASASHHPPPPQRWKLDSQPFASPPAVPV